MTPHAKPRACGAWHVLRRDLAGALERRRGLGLHGPSQGGPHGSPLHRLQPLFRCLVAPLARSADRSPVPPRAPSGPPVEDGAQAAMRRSISISGRRPTAGRSRSCSRSAGLPYTRDPGEHLQGRAVQAGVPGDLAQQPHAGDRRSSMARAAGRSRSSSRARSCNISAARPENSIRATSAGASRSSSGCIWQMANLGPKAGEANHFRDYAPEQLPTTPIDRFSNEMQSPVTA